MHGIGVQVAVILDDEVLLFQREDFEVWGLPGGEIEPGETPAQAAIREVYEETGLEVRLTRLVGLYTRPQWTGVNATNVVFAAEIVGGDMKAAPDEVLDLGFFSRDQLPEPLVWWSRQEIEDALNHIGGSAVWHQDVPWPAGFTSRADVYRTRDESGLSRAEYFNGLFPPGPEKADIEGTVVRDGAPPAAGIR